MRAGKLRHQITIQYKTVAPDSEGIMVEAWSTLDTVWASVEPISGREFFAAASVQSEVTSRIRIRYRSGVTPENRILWGSRIYDILTVIDPDERHQELQLMCREEVAGG